MITHQLEHRSNYILVKQALSRDVCDLLSQYALFKAAMAPQTTKSGDPLYAIHREYGDPLMETLLHQFTPLIEHATNTELWPTLSFYYTYKKGNELKKHKDRSSCQYVAGLCIGADENHLKTNHQTWPLMLNSPQGPEPIELDVGDIVIFKGHDIEHWREPFTGDWFVSAIFAYVEKNGPFSYQKFDQRSALGKPHVGMFRWFLKELIKKWIPRSSS